MIDDHQHFGVLTCLEFLQDSDISLRGMPRIPSFGTTGSCLKTWKVMSPRAVDRAVDRSVLRWKWAWECVQTSSDKSDVAIWGSICMPSWLIATCAFVLVNHWEVPWWPVVTPWVRWWLVQSPGAKPLILKPRAMTTESEVDPTQQPELAHSFRQGRISCLIQSYLSYIVFSLYIHTHYPFPFLSLSLSLIVLIWNCIDVMWCNNVA